MKILIVASTEREVNLVVAKALNVRKIAPSLFSGKWGSADVDFLITGIGMPFCLFKLSSHLAKNNYDLIINPGTAASYKDSFRLGSVVNVVSEQFADLGIDDNAEFKTWFDIGYMDKNSHPFHSGVLVNTYDTSAFSAMNTLQKVNAITVNTMAGSEALKVHRWVKFQPDIESADGAAVLYICVTLNIPCIELRAITNKVEPRNTKVWNMPQALISLGEHVNYLLSEIDRRGVV